MIERLATVRKWLAAYVGNDDPLVAMCNKIAVLLGLNQPFYPLFVYWIVSDRYEPALFTLLSMPLFLAVPAIAKRHPKLARLTLCGVGTANTVLGMLVLGQASGVEVFLLPCALLAATIFLPSERLQGLLLSGVIFGSYLGISQHQRVQPQIYSIGEYASLYRLNFSSALTLTIFVGWLLSSLSVKATSGRHAASVDRSSDEERRRR